jgi:predicted secreted protein
MGAALLLTQAQVRRAILLMRPILPATVLMVQAAAAVRAATTHQPTALLVAVVLVLMARAAEAMTALVLGTVESSESQQSTENLMALRLTTMAEAVVLAVLVVLTEKTSGPQLAGSKTDGLMAAITAAAAAVRAPHGVAAQAALAASVSFGDLLAPMKTSRAPSQAHTQRKTKPSQIALRS